MDFIKKPAQSQVPEVNGRREETRPLSISTSRKISTPTAANPQLKSPKTNASENISAKSPLKSDIRSPTKTPENMRVSPSIGQVILRKPSSVAFYINLMDSDYKPSQYRVDDSMPSATTPRSPTKSPSVATPLQPPALVLAPVAPITIPSFPKIRTRMTGKDLAALLDKKMALATQKRNAKLTERTQKLAKQAQTIKFRMMIHESRMRLERLRIEAKGEYNSSSAMLNRQIHLRKIKEKFGSKVEHAKRVMLLQKMKKYVEMRRALSENFADLLRVDEVGEFPTESDARMTPLGLSVTIDERESESEDEHEHEKETYVVPKTTPSPSPTEFHKDYTSSYIFAQSPKTRSESLSDQIRRTKSLPDLVLKTSDDSTFLDLLSLLPPITRFNLRELEMDEILSNSQLRHDLIFDADLKFKATDSDDPESQQKTLEYWSEVRAEVESGEYYRIPLLLSEIRAILVELLPSGQEQKEEIFGMIDTHLIAQQISHGIMQPKGLIDYISSVMKVNCAPIRDVVVDKMVKECEEGKLVDCLQTCFEILELMKLDYANHQMTKLRPYIVQHGVEFEWKLFRNQLEAGLASVTTTKSWLTKCWDAYKSTAKSPNPAYDLFPEAFMEVVSRAPRFSEDNVLPETWKMDTSRLVSFYNSWQDITILGTILIVFRQISGPKCHTDDIVNAKKGLWILLNDSDSTMSHITLQMASLASKIRGFAMSVKETTDLNVMVEKTLAPGSKLYELVQKRVGMHIENGLYHRKIDEELLTKHGLTTLKEEIEELIAKVVPVADMNRAVYGNLYAALLEDIKSETESRISVLLRES